MSSTAPTGSTTTGTTATAQAAQASGRGAGRAAPGNDLFAQLMLLLGSGSDAPAALLPEAGAATPVSATPPSAADALPDTAATDNPLAALLAWTGVVQPQTPAAAGRSTSSAESDAMTASVDGNTVLPGQTKAEAPLEGAVALPAGLQRLAQPEALDANTLAAWGRAQTTETPLDASVRPLTGAENADSLKRSVEARTETTANPFAASRPAGPRNAPHGVPGVGLSGAPGLRMQVLRASEGLAPPVLMARSTVQLDERFAQQARLQALNPTEPPAEVSAAAGEEPGSVGSDRARPPSNAVASATAESGGPVEAGATDSGGHDPSHPDGQAAASDTAAARQAEDDTAVAWNAQQLRQASLRLGEAGEQALDIQLNLQGQELQVNFRTDDEQTRAQLAQDAATLGEWLQRSGIELGSVSVGAQGDASGQQAQGQAASRGPQARRGEAASSTTGGAEPAPPPVQRPRTDGNRPLDLFV